MNVSKTSASSVGCLLIAVAPRLAAQSATVIIEKIIVKVNGEIFTQTELESASDSRRFAKQNPASARPEDLQNDAGLRAALATVTPDLLVDAVDELLLVQHGREIGAQVHATSSSSGVDRAVKKDNKIDDAQLQAALKQEGHDAGPTCG